MYEMFWTAWEWVQSCGPFVRGLTTTPWRSGGEGPDHPFDGPTITNDLIEEHQQGFLANVDYRMHTDNVDWMVSGTFGVIGSRPRPLERNPAEAGEEAQAMSTEANAYELSPSSALERVEQRPSTRLAIRRVRTVVQEAAEEYRRLGPCWRSPDPSGRRPRLWAG